MGDWLGYCVAAAVLAGASPESGVIKIGSRLELFVDSYLIDKLNGAALVLREPVPGEKVLEFDRPWEGRHCGYVTILHDAGQYRIYYRGLPVSGKDGSLAEVTCCAQSTDGIHWTKPNLRIYEVDGTRENNVVLAAAAPFSHNFCPFIDSRPGVPAVERYKAVAGTSETGLVAFVSEDGLHWAKLREEPIFTKGAFDSQNLVFWSEAEGCYCCYFRTFADGIRRISRTTSADLLTWSEPVMMEYGGAPIEHMYTNQTRPYFRAPHIYVAIAARFMQGRRIVPPGMASQVGVEEGYAGDCSDAVFLTTRGGGSYDRTFMGAFVRPGIGLSNWTSRTNYPAWGVVPTGPDEMSFYIQRNYGQPSHYLQRFTLRLDGFASVSAPYAGGEMTTKPVTFEGHELVINYSTSAAGSMWVEIQDDPGNPIPGFTREDSDEIIGDEIERAVSWRGRTELTGLAGKPVRLRFVMKDADLFSVRFR